VKVLLVTHNYPRHAGDPAGAFVARLADGLAERDVEVRVIAPHAPGLPEEGVEGRVRVRRVRYGPDSVEVVAYSGALHRRAFRSLKVAAVLPWFLAAFRRAIRQELRSFHPDVLHAHWWMPSGFLAAGLGCPFVVTSHGTDVRLLEHWPLRALSRHVFRRAGAVTAVSGFLARDLETRLGGVAGGVKVTPMPVDIGLFEKGQRVPKAIPARILYVGNLLPSKGVDVLVRAVALLRKEGLACRLRIVGDGPARSSLQALVDRLAVSGVEWAGWVPQTGMAEEYGAATVTVLPTRGNAEGLGLALVEALIAGSAIIGSPAGGIPEVITDGVTGLIARDGDPVDLAAKLKRMLGDESFRAKTVAAGREHVRRNHDSAHAIPRFLDAYRVALDRANR
jgi:glycosyltransferase involved in cell wall biosynthesis